MDDRSFLSSFQISRSFSAFGGASVTNYSIGNDCDFTCDRGIADYLKIVRATTLTKSRMEKKFFARRLDGLRHGSVHVIGNELRCQYCYYQWKQLGEQEKKSAYFMKNNRKQLHRCLVCNVNLCPICENEFHGVQMSETGRLFGKV